VPDILQGMESLLLDLGTIKLGLIAFVVKSEGNVPIGFSTKKSQQNKSKTQNR
jgi:hypothetical protein